MRSHAQETIPPEFVDCIELVANPHCDNCGSTERVDFEPAHSTMQRRPGEFLGAVLGKQEPKMQIVMSRLGTLGRFGQTLGPYLMLEILLPGGTLLALLLFLYQRRKLDTGSVAARTAVAVTRALASIVEQGIFVLRPCYLRPSQAFHPFERDGLESREAPGNRKYR